MSQSTFLHFLKYRFKRTVGLSVIGFSLLGATAQAMSLKDSVSEALATNPDILGSAENREAIEFELRQAMGLYLPSIDLEASVGSRRLDSPGRRRLGTEDDTLTPADASLTLSQTLFDGGARRESVARQAARVDGASFRVAERSEAIALAVAQEYFEILLQSEIVGVARSNVSLLGQILRDIAEGVSSGALTRADELQGKERLLAAKGRLQQAKEDLTQAKIRFSRLVGKNVSKFHYPPSIRNSVPRNAKIALDIGRRQSPRIAAAGADVNAADAHAREARSSYLPGVSLTLRGRVGSDVDGAEGSMSDVEGKIVARWNLYRGGRDDAIEQERIRRAGESRQQNRLVHREVKESIETAWDRRSKRSGLASILRQQTSTNANLVSSYRAQFKIGERSLLDVLSAQNTRFNSEVLEKTASYAAVYADYQLLAAMGSLTSSLNVTTVSQAEAYAQNEFETPVSVETSEFIRKPSRQVKAAPLDLLAPLK